MSDIKVFASVPPGPDNTIIAGPAGAPKNPPPGYKLTTHITPEISQIAIKLLSKEYGTITPFEIDGKKYIAQNEPHPPHAQPPLDHWHRGVTIYEPINDLEEH